MSDRGGAVKAQRLDKWLWHARIIKTRALAAQLVSKGKFRVNREKIVKPAFTVKQGDVITTALFGKVRILQVASFAERRGPAVEAQKLYADLTPAPTPEDAAAPIYERPTRRSHRVRKQWPDE